MPSKKRKRIELVTKDTPKAESNWRGISKIKFA